MSLGRGQAAAEAPLPSALPGRGGSGACERLHETPVPSGTALPKGLAWLCRSPLGWSRVLPPLPVPLGRLEAPGLGEMPAGRPCGWLNGRLVVVRGVTHRVGLCMFLWKGAEFAVLPSLPVAARVDTRAHTCPSVLTSVGGS